MNHDNHGHGCCGGGDTAVATKDGLYICPMHPNVKEEISGKCPECGMNLVPEKKANH